MWFGQIKGLTEPAGEAEADRAAPAAYRGWSGDRVDLHVHIRPSTSARALLDTFCLGGDGSEGVQTRTERRKGNATDNETLFLKGKFALMSRVGRNLGGKFALTIRPRSRTRRSF